MFINGLHVFQYTMSLMRPVQGAHILSIGRNDYGQQYL
jgi:hypothetical protein